MKYLKRASAYVFGPATILFVSLCTPISPFVGVHFVPKVLILASLCAISVVVAYVSEMLYDWFQGVIGGFVVATLPFLGLPLIAYPLLVLTVLVLVGASLTYFVTEPSTRIGILVLWVMLAIAGTGSAIAIHKVEYPAFDNASKYMLKNFKYGDAVVYAGNSEYERYVSRNQWNGAGEAQPWDAYLGCTSTITCAEGLEDIDRVWVETRYAEGPYVGMDTKHKQPLMENFKQVQRIKFDGHVYLFLLQKV